VVASDTINISVEKIVYPFKDGQDADWQKDPTMTWKGVAVAEGWGITNALINFIVTPTLLGNFETRRPDRPDKEATDAVNVDSYVHFRPPLTGVPQNGFTLSFTFAFPKNHGPDTTGYVQAAGISQKASFVGNSGIKFGTYDFTTPNGKIATKDVEVAVLDVPAMLVFAGQHEQSFNKGAAPDGRPEWKLQIVDHVINEDPTIVAEGVTTLLNGVRYGGNIANLSQALISEANVQALGGTDDPETAKPILDSLFGTSGEMTKPPTDPSKDGGKMTIDVTRQVDGTYTLQVKVGETLTYEETGIDMIMDVPRFQSHWGSGVTFKEVSYSAH